MKLGVRPSNSNVKILQVTNALMGPDLNGVQAYFRLVNVSLEKMTVSKMSQHLV